MVSKQERYSQTGNFTQLGIDTGLPAFAILLEIGDDIGVEQHGNLLLLLVGRQRRTAPLGVSEELFIEFQGFAVKAVKDQL